MLGQEHPDTLTSMDNLASTYQNQGRWKEAEELEVQVMETKKEGAGPGASRHADQHDQPGLDVPGSRTVGRGGGAGGEDQARLSIRAIMHNRSPSAIIDNKLSKASLALQIMGDNRVPGQEHPFTTDKYGQLGVYVEIRRP